MKIIISFAIFLYSLSIAASEIEPLLPVGTQQSCVEPTDIMRRDHMEFLNHQRNNTVRHGLRTRKHSLNGCVQCHVQKDEQGDFIPVNAPGQFCQGCHVYVSVKLDCFECHATKPAVNLTTSELSSEWQSVAELITENISVNCQVPPTERKSS